MKPLHCLFLVPLLLPTCDSLPGGAPVDAPAGLGSRVARGIPPRPVGAIGGREFGNRTVGLGGRARQSKAIAQLLSGNLPDFLRHLHPIEMVDPDTSAGDVSSLVVWVMPDYLAIGSDDDFLRIPLTRPSIAAVSTAFDMAIPTTRIVDAVYAAADVHCRPLPMTPGPKMRSAGYYLKHQEMIEAQAGIRSREALVAGDKKDIVVSNRLLQRPDRVAIYGWHRGPGDPIQPLSTVHGARYADYSHGVRLIDTVVLVDGVERSYYDALSDPRLAPLLSDEGVIAGARFLVTGIQRAPVATTGR